MTANRKQDQTASCRHVLPASNALSRSHALAVGLDGRDEHGHDGEL
jgi:hypothetical protein